MPNRAWGYQLRNGAQRNQDPVSRAANSTADGTLYLSALDYARWEAGVFGGKVLRPESWTGHPVTIARHLARMLDPKLTQPQGAPIDDRKPQVTEQLERLLQQIATDRTDYRDFAFISKEDLAELLSGYRKTMRSLGSQRELVRLCDLQNGDYSAILRLRTAVAAPFCEVQDGICPTPRAPWPGSLLSPGTSWNRKDVLVHARIS